MPSVSIITKALTSRLHTTREITILSSRVPLQAVGIYLGASDGQILVPERLLVHFVRIYYTTETVRMCHRCIKVDSYNDSSPELAPILSGTLRDTNQDCRTISPNNSVTPRVTPWSPTASTDVVCSLTGPEFVGLRRWWYLLTRCRDIKHERIRRRRSFPTASSAIFAGHDSQAGGHHHK